MRRAVLLFAALALAAAFSSCLGGGGSAPDPNAQLLQVQEFAADPGLIDLDLHGPSGAGNSAVTYFVFGSHESLGDHSMVPLEAQRLDETTVATLGFGENLTGVDLSAWDGFEYVYLRAIPCQPQIIILLKPGRRYVVSSS